VLARGPAEACFDLSPSADPKRPKKLRLSAKAKRKRAFWLHVPAAGPFPQPRARIPLKPIAQIAFLQSGTPYAFYGPGLQTIHHLLRKKNSVRVEGPLARSAKNPPPDSLRFGPEIGLAPRQKRNVAPTQPANARFCPPAGPAKVGKCSLPRTAKPTTVWPRTARAPGKLQPCSGFLDDCHAAKVSRPLNFLSHRKDASRAIFPPCSRPPSAKRFR